MTRAIPWKRRDFKGDTIFRCKLYSPDAKRVIMFLVYSPGEE